MPETTATAPAARRRSRRGEGAALRQDLLRAAMDLLRETGDEDAVSVRAVAQRVGVSVPSIYLHFADKQALLDAVCEEVFEQLHVRLREAGEEGDDPFDGLRRQGNAYVRFALENPEHYRIVMMRSHDPGPESRDQLIASGAFGYLVESVRACIDAGVFEGDAVELALSLWAAAHGVAALLVAKPYFPWPDLAEFVDRTICMAGIGLAAGSRFDPDNELPLDDVVAVLDRLRP
ncbi:MAG TPA: TetR/AcrR family transcriptional regulator [Mycobacteriales bacterium]|nr:TetR/AcrR family transcriptional regulator [Mycobacteriales bacterium]